jgi:biotin-(acetyl-CoA carboxylase) ligase
VATAMDIDEHFRLIVRYEDGTEEHLDGGEVSIRW